MASANVKYVVNELLMYMFSKLDTDNTGELKNVVSTFYGEEAVNDAKNILWEHYTGKLDRNINRRSKLKQIDDIIEAVRTIDVSYPDRDALPVRYVAVRTNNLPFVCAKISCENLPTTPPRDDLLATRVAALELQMAEVISNPRASNVNVASTAPPANSYSHRVQHGGQHRQPGPVIQFGPEPEQSMGRYTYNTAQIPARQSTVTVIPSSENQIRQASGVPTRRPPEQEWKVAHRHPHRRPTAVYGTKQSQGLKAPPRSYECVVFNITSPDKEEVTKWMKDNDIDALDAVRLSNEAADVHLYKIKVLHKDKDKILTSEFWPEYVGCRPYFRKKKPIQNNEGQINRPTNNNDG